jgi:hypothetical protein
MQAMNILLTVIVVQLSPSENDAMTPEAALIALTSLGRVLGQSSGFNPMDLLQGLLSRDDMLAMIGDILELRNVFPLPTDEQLAAAQQYVYDRME